MKTQIFLDFVIELVDIEVDKLNEFPDWVVKQMEESILMVEELAWEGPSIFEEESVNMYHAKQTKESKNLKLGKKSLKNKKVMERWSFNIEIDGLKPTRILRLH